MNILVTGGSGFLGSHVADQLSNIGHKVTIYDKKKSNWLRTDQKMIIGNILDSSKLEKAISKSDIIFHFAAIADIDESLKKPIDSTKINIFGTVLALELCKKYKIKRFIHASTIYVNSSEGGFYRCSKKAAEEYVEEYGKIYGIKYTILRFGSLYGERSDNTNGIFNVIYKAIKTNKVSYVGNKNSIREYIHVKDAAKACSEILKKKYINKHIILTGKKKIKVSKFLKSVAKILNIKKKIKYQNKQYTGHYTKTPYTFKPKKGKKFKFKQNVIFENGLNQLVKKIKVK